MTVGLPEDEKLAMFLENRQSFVAQATGCEL